MTTVLEAMQHTVEQVLKAIGSQKEEARIKKVIAVVREAGADPIATWREIAVCKDDREVVAIGFARDTPIEAPILVQKVKIALGDEPGAVLPSGRKRARRASLRRAETWSSRRGRRSTSR